eukprot:TRINITY_DN60302_c0_g1_i1.p1 TRINITY_DN60302_c0_g1~~TRINITY_DN60302_c0_g1_i1.p1  ORF type:complete len:496 (-),score=78.29 TRINITY_DN60302_c0_g1_i1:204-1691(-)
MEMVAVGSRVPTRPSGRRDAWSTVKLYRNKPMPSACGDDRMMMSTSEKHSRLLAGPHLGATDGVHEYAEGAFYHDGCNLKPCQLSARWSRLSIAHKSQEGADTRGLAGCERILMQCLHKSLRCLDVKLRRSVLATRFTQAQRLALERWMLTRPRGHKVAGKRNNVDTARQHLPIKRVMEKDKPCPEETAERKCKSHRVSSASLYKTEHGLEHVPGLIVHPGHGHCKECYYSAIVTIGRIRLLTKEHRSLQVVRSFHTALTAFKKRMESVRPVAFEDSFREVLTTCLREHGLEARAMGLRFCVCLAALWLPRPLITPPFKAEGEAMDAGLRAWRRLGDARGLVLQRGSVLQVLSPDEIAAAWGRVRAAYLDIVSEVAAGEEPQAFKQREAAFARLRALEAAQGSQREKQLERWNSRQMAQEEAYQRSCSRRALREQASPQGTQRERHRLARQELALRSLDRLLWGWSRMMPPWLRTDDARNGLLGKEATPKSKGIR